MSDPYFDAETRTDLEKHGIKVSSVPKGTTPAGDENGSKPPEAVKTPSRPTRGIRSVDLAGIPDEMKRLDRWVVWNYETRPGEAKPTKVPYCAFAPAKHASSTDPQTWGTYEQAVKCLETDAGHGIGWVIRPPYIGIDWDNCRNPETGEFDSVILKEIQAIGSYAEVSPSGTGAHVLTRGKHPGDGRGKKRNDREMYSTGRYFTVTGQHISGTPTEIRDGNPDAIQHVYDKIQEKPGETVAPEKKPTGVLSGATPTLTDDEILEKCRNAKNSAKFNALWRGDTAGYQSHSEADMALCNVLAFYSQDPTQIERLIRQSGLYREKWDRADYATATIGNAIQNCRETWTPAQKESKVSPPAEEMSEEEFNNTRGENPRLTINLPEDSLIQLYLRYVAERSDSYPEYQHGAILALMGCAVNRRGVLEMTIGDIYPNVWIFLLGQSTVSRKSTACDFALEFVEMLFPWLRVSYPGSSEGFVEDLEGDDRVDGPENKGHGLLVVDEAVGLLKLMQRQYMADLRDLMCNLYDNRAFSRKIRSGQRKKKTFFSLPTPYLNVLLATTPNNFSAEATLADVQSGWLLRFLPYYPNYVRPMRDVDHMTDGARDLQRTVYRRLKEIFDLFRKERLSFKLSEDALQFYNRWRNKHIDELQRSQDDDAGAFDRLSIYALKMAMLYTIADARFIETVKAPFSGMPEIDTGYLKEACRQVDEYFLPMSRIFADMVGRDEQRNLIEKVLGIVRRAGGKITRTKLMQRAHVKKKDLDEALESLEESKEVTEVQVGGERAYVLCQ